MKNKWKRAVLTWVVLGWVWAVQAQCSICTKTASQLGRESAEGFNKGIIYLMLLPFAIGAFIAYRWWKGEKNAEV